MDRERHYRQPRWEDQRAQQSGSRDGVQDRLAGGAYLEAMSVSAAKKSSVEKARGRVRVLVVDDEASVLYTYQMILERQGYEVVAASTSKEAKDAIARHEFDLILCDYSLEQQHTGFEVIAAARERRPDVPSIMLTGYATLE